MKKTMIIILTLISFSTLAGDAEQLKQAALKGCATKLENVLEEVRAQSKKTCECIVNKTDYEAVLQAQKNGDNEKVQQDALKAAEACAKQA